MVETLSLPQVSTLMQSYTNYRQALDIIDDGGRISSFVLAGPIGSATVLSDDIEYPRQMLEAIRDQIAARLDDLEKDLSDLGVEFPRTRR